MFILSLHYVQILTLAEDKCKMTEKRYKTIQKRYKTIQKRYKTIQKRTFCIDSFQTFSIFFKLKILLQFNKSKLQHNIVLQSWKFYYFFF